MWGDTFLSIANNCYCRKREVYQCSDLEKFFDTVTERVESLQAKTIADILHGFLNQ